jgi:hypothetical protein
MSAGLIHRLVLASRHAPIVGNIYKSIYQQAAKTLASRLHALGGVRGVILHRGMTRPGWEPGVSDIDLIVMIDDNPGLETRLLGKIAKVRERCQWFFPMLGDFWIGTESEIQSYLQWGGLRAWEDVSTWQCLAGEMPSVVENRESPEKRQLLDPWVWILQSHMEITRRLASGRGAKNTADMRKLTYEQLRLSRWIGTGSKGLPKMRFEMSALEPEVVHLSPEKLWEKSWQDLCAVSRVVLEALSPAVTVDLEFPRPQDIHEATRMQKVLAAGAACVVLDVPYHCYALVEPDTTTIQAMRLLGEMKELPGVPLVLPTSVWSLLLQSSYLGAPLGWLSKKSVREDPVGLYSDWGLRAVGQAPAVSVLRKEWVRECLAEAASWMALWRRAMWIDTAWHNRFVLFHLHTRTAGLRLAFVGECEPFSAWQDVMDRAAMLFQDERELYTSLARFAREEPTECIDDFTRSALACEHDAVLAEQHQRLQGALAQGVACLEPSH